MKKITITGCLMAALLSTAQSISRVIPDKTDYLNMFFQTQQQNDLEEELGTPFQEPTTRAATPLRPGTPLRLGTPLAMPGIPIEQANVQNERAASPMQLLAQRALDILDDGDQIPDELTQALRQLLPNAERSQAGTPNLTDLL